MAQEDAAKEKSSTRLLIRNIGLLLSGDLVKPILKTDTRWPLTARSRL